MGGGTPPPAPPVPTGPGHANWAKTLEDARTQARKDGKVVYVELGKPGCAECSRMEQLLYPAVQFEMTLLRMVPVRLRFDDPAATALEQKYHVNNVPAVLVMTPEGALIFRMVSFDNAASFYHHINAAMKDYDAFNLRAVQEPTYLNDPKAELALGVDYYRRFDSVQAVPRLERAVAEAKADETTREQALSYLASAQLDLNNPDKATQAVDTILKNTKDPVRREEAELFRAQISVVRGYSGDAVARLQKFIHDHPGSPRIAQAQSLLQAIQQSGQLPK